MSELNSLFVHVEIKKENLQQFFFDKPSPARIDENWLRWWSSRDMYGNKEVLTSVSTYPTTFNRIIVDDHLRDRRMGAMENYDESTGTWTFIVLFFSENYTEILPMLAFLKSLASYQTEEEQGIAIIYDFYWGDESVMAYLEFANRSALLQNFSTTSEITSSILKEANQKLERLSNELAGFN